MHPADAVLFFGMGEIYLKVLINAIPVGKLFHDQKMMGVKKPPRGRFMLLGLVLFDVWKPDVTRQFHGASNLS